MGNSGNSGKPTAENRLAVAKGSERQRMLKDLAEQHKGEDQQDFYQLFGLERYAIMGSANQELLKSSSRKLLLKWHPDKNGSSKKDICEVMTVKIVCGRKVLEDPDLKRRYDLELRKIYGEQSAWSSVGWFSAWGWNVLSMAGGLALVIGGAVGAPFTGGFTTTACLAGSTLLSSGIAGTVKLVTDPDCSTTEYLKDLGVGAAQGLAGGGIGCAAGPAMQGASAAAKIGHAAWCGAGTYAAAHGIKDGTDLAVTKGLLGQEIQENISDAKTSAEVFSSDNAARLVVGSMIGACAGMATQAVANKFAASVQGASQNKIDGTLVDDAVNAGTQVTKNAIDNGGKAAKKAIEEGGEAAANQIRKRVLDTLGQVQQLEKDCVFTLSGVGKHALANGAGVAVGSVGGCVMETTIGVVHAVKAGRSPTEALRQVVPGTIRASLVQFAIGAGAAVVAGAIQHGAATSQTRKALQTKLTEFETLQSELEKTVASNGKCPCAEDIDRALQCSEMKLGPGKKIKRAENEHTFERHVGPLEQAEARVKCKSNAMDTTPSLEGHERAQLDQPVSVFSNSDEAERCINDAVLKLRSDLDPKMENALNRYKNDKRTFSTFTPKPVFNKKTKEDFQPPSKDVVHQTWGYDHTFGADLPSEVPAVKIVGTKGELQPPIDRPLHQGKSYSPAAGHFAEEVNQTILGMREVNLDMKGPVGVAVKYVDGAFSYKTCSEVRVCFKATPRIQNETLHVDVELITAFPWADNDAPGWSCTTTAPRMAHVDPAALNAARMAAAPAIVLNALLQSASSQVCTTVPLCPQRHVLTQFVAPHNGFVCDLCDEPQRSGSRLHGCRECDHDLCANCFAASLQCSQGHALTKFASETATFVCDGCEEAQPRGASLFGCRHCNFDLCAACIS